MGNLLCSRNRYIVPFMIDFSSGCGFDDTARRIARNQFWDFQDMHQSNIEQDLYGVILDSFVLNERKNNIGCSFIYTGEIGCSFDYTRFNRPYIVSISKIGLYIFRSGIGMIWYEADIPVDSSLDEFILFQNEFKELAYERYVRKNKQNGRYNFETTKEQQPLLMGHWIDELLSGLELSHKYFAMRKDPLDAENVICDKALIFEYAVFDDKSKENVYDYMYRLTNGYNERYQRKSDFADNIVSPFENAYYYATTGGCGYYAVPNESNANFYLRTLKSKIMLDYFTLYILALYQSYSVLKFTGTIEDRLPADSEYYLNNPEDTLNEIKQFETDINIFLVKSVYSSVSHINHQNDYYIYVTDRLRIKDNIEGLTIGLDSLRKLQESREKERLEKIESSENTEREIADDRINIGLGMLSVLAIVSAISDGYGSSEVLVKIFGLPMAVKPVLDIILMVIIVAVGTIAISSIASSIRRAGKKRRDYKRSKKGQK